MTGILFGPISVRVAVNSVCSSAASAAGGGGGGRGGGGGDRSGGGDAVALLEALDELGQLEDGHLVDRLEQIVLGQDCHRWFSFGMSGCRWVPGRAPAIGCPLDPGEMRVVGYSAGLAAAFWSRTWRARNRGCAGSPRGARPASRSAPAWHRRGWPGAPGADGSEASRVTAAASIAPVAEDGAGDLHDLERPGRVEDGAGRRRLVAPAERDGRRADEERPEGRPGACPRRRS